MIHIEVSKCLACKSCELECAVSHSRSESLYEAVRNGERPQKRIVVESIGALSIPLQCRHCEDAPCVAVCPTGAMEKLGTEEPVLIREERCIGCKACVAVCPFGVIYMSNEGRAVVKCDLCIDRLERGERPACVMGCPTGAIQFKSVEEISREARRRAKENFLVAVERGESV
ncbi:MAG: 4Fe-4S dicluster domain-containing protein [bacterium]